MLSVLNVSFKEEKASQVMGRADWILAVLLFLQGCSEFQFTSNNGGVF
jgi:hypothetical protein